MIKKAIIPIAGLATRFLPLSKVVPKELWPLADLPSIHYIIKEAKDSGIRDIIFVLRQDNKKVLDYLKPCRKTEKILRERKKTAILEQLKNVENLCSDLNISYVLQAKPGGDGHAILQAAKLIKDEPVLNMFGDDLIDSQVPCGLQLANIFKTCQKPVIALRKLPKERISAYGVAGIEKIANKLYKIKSIVEKPKVEQAPSDLAIVGRHILTPEVFHYLRKATPGKKGEIVLAEVIHNQMLADGKVIYGYEFEGEWLECGDKLKWMKSDIYFSLHHSKYGAEIKEYIKSLRI